MKLFVIAALIAVCGAAKLDRTYLPPPSAATAGGSSESLQTPLTKTSEQGDSSGNLPNGSYTNSFQGVVVDAAGAGTRSSPDGDQSGLGGPRDAYGSQNSKVGDAAFRGSIAGFRNTLSGGLGFNEQVTGTNAAQNLGSFETKSERPQAAKDRNSNIIIYANDVSLDNYSYGFESDNGIAVGENGVANNGIQAQGGYSYKGDDGQVYKITYVADEGGYRPQGDHLPTPPPIPKEILISLEKNAKDEAAGLIDDGSYDAQKYNAEGDYTHHNSGNIQYNAQFSQFTNRPESDATASNSFINQNSQSLVKPGQFGNDGVQNNQPNFKDQSNQFVSASNQNSFIGSQQLQSSQTLNRQQASSSTGQVSGQFGQNVDSQLAQLGQIQGTIGSQSSLTKNQNDQKAPLAQLGTQSSQLMSQSNLQASIPQPGLHTIQSQQQYEFNSQLNGHASGGFASSFGHQLNSPSFGAQSVIKSQQNQFNNQAFQPQNTFGAGEYLPPYKKNENTSYKKPQSNEIPRVQDLNKDNKSSDGQQKAFSQGSGMSSLASLGSTSSQTQPAQTFSGSQNQQNQFNISNGQPERNSFPTSSQNIGSNLTPGLASGAKPTSVPSIELTTPLEPNKTPVFPQNSQVIGQSNLSFGNFGSQSLANKPHIQTSFQHSVTAAQQHTSQILSPSFADSGPQKTSQFGSTSPAPSAFSTTQKPGIQSSFSQGPDDSYYYNQPSKPFGTSGDHPQGSSFPNSPSYQSNRVVSSHNHQFFNQQGTQTNINNLSSSLPASSVAPTSSSQFSQSHTSHITNQYNGLTQASISPFPSVSSTISTQDDSTQAGFFGSKPNPSFSTKPTNSFVQNPSTPFTQNQFQYGQSSSFNNNLPSVSQSLQFKPIDTFAPTSFTQSQTQFEQASINNDQPQNPETNQVQGVTSSQTQQYEGTVYEYNKPPEVLPASEQSDSSSSQTVQSNLALTPEDGMKFNSQKTQANQYSPSSQQSGSYQGSKPQFVSQTFRPFGSQQSGQNTVSQNSQPSISQQNIQAQSTLQQTKPNASLFSSTSNQFSQIQPTGLKPQSGSPSATSATTFGIAASTSELGQNVQQINSFKPFDGSQTITQFSQIAPSPNTQNVQQPFGTTGLIQNGGSQNSHGYSSSKPQFGNQLTLPQFTQSSQHLFGSTQINSQVQPNAISAQPFGNAPTVTGQEINQGSGSFGQQPFPAPQFGSLASKPQFSNQPQFGLSQNMQAKPFSSATSQAQFGPNSAQASSSVVSQSSGVQAYKPFEALAQNKPQFDQAPQSSAVSTTSAPQLNGQSFNTQESPNQTQGFQSHSPPCCKRINTDSAIVPLNVGKPSQAFAQTQSQFSGFSGAQFNAQNVAGKGEEFGGPRQPPSFDAQTGYHY